MSSIFPQCYPSQPGILFSNFSTQLACKDRDSLLSLFQRGIKAASGASRDAEVEPLMAALNIVSLQEHWLLKLLCFCYDVASPATTSAQCVRRILSSPAVSSCLTMSQASGTVAVPWCSTKCGRNALYNRALLLWNSLPACLRSSPTKLVFKTDVWKLLADPQIKNKCMSLAFSPLS